MGSRPAPDRRLIGAAGVAALLLFGIGNSLWAFDVPDQGASARELLDFYSDKSNSIEVGVSLSFAAFAAFLYFAAGLRTLLARFDADGALAMAALLGALVAAACGLASQTINLAAGTLARHGDLGGSTARSCFEIARALGFHAAPVGFGLLLIAIAAISLRARAVMPRWLAGLTIVVGLALFSPIAPAALHPAVLLLIAVSVLVIRAPGRDAAASPS